MDKTLCARLIKAQSMLKTLPKDKKGYGYRYTDLDTVITTLRPVLQECGLGFTQGVCVYDTESGGAVDALVTIVFDVDGNSEEFRARIPSLGQSKMNGAQCLGAAITYMRRYALCAVFGLSSDEDTDAVVQPAPAPLVRGNEQQQISAMMRDKNPDGSRVFTDDECDNIRRVISDDGVLTAYERVKKEYTKRKAQYLGY